MPSGPELLTPDIDEQKAPRSYLLRGACRLFADQERETNYAAGMCPEPCIRDLVAAMAGRPVDNFRVRERSRSTGASAGLRRSALRLLREELAACAGLNPYAASSSKRNMT